MTQLKKRIKQSFGGASQSYDSVAQLQRNVGKSLLNKLDDSEQFGIAVDLGCGTGFLINEFLAQKKGMATQFIALDIAMPMLQAARKKQMELRQITYLCADLEYLPLLPQSADLVISNLALQWSSNLDVAFAGIKRVLKPGGRLLFSTFGTSTLFELKEAWRKVDDYAHVNTFTNESQLSDFLRHAGFSKVELETEVVVSCYESVWDLMGELKTLGARTVISGCNKHLTSKSAMERMICAYYQREGNGLVPATFEVITVSAIA
ncbi:MAG: malonyl-ACP O-methyltransferase BioC [Methylococcaceae bacterium]|nr:malonyl-ACP O-methyltransferase BioC [Methylococcaceae bacterium]